MKDMKFNVAQIGFAAGKVYVYNRESSTPFENHGAEAELTRLRDAIDSYEKILVRRAETGGRKVKDISEIEIMLMKEDSYAGKAEELISRQGMSAADALKEAEACVVKQFRDTGDPYIIGRCEDIRGITAGLTALIQNGGNSLPTEPCIIVAGELSPGELSLINHDNILGIITEAGSPASHLSIMAGNMGVPYFCGADGLLVQIRDGDFVIMDSDEGSIRLNPPKEIMEEAAIRQQNKKAEREERSKRKFHKPTGVKVFANIAGVEDIEALKQSEAGGVGLFRTEFLFLKRETDPTEDEQFEAYRTVAENIYPKEVVIRTMDIGADKKVPWLQLKDERNPQLGKRGVRVSLDKRDMFRKQLRALLRAAAFGNIKIMVPMIASPWEIDEVCKEIEVVSKELEECKIPYKVPELGIMVETPAAAVTADVLAEKVNFFSIGTNDLTQYTLAIDREAQGLDEYFDPLHEAVFGLIKMTVQAARRHGISVAICGELAGDPKAIPRLVEIGVDELSVSVGKVDSTLRYVYEAENAAAGCEAATDVLTFPEPITSPADGELVQMENIPDEAFSGGMMGECLGVRSIDGIIYSPCSGTVKSVAATRHAVTLESSSGENILIHAGIDTVKLGGEGFTVNVSEGENVKQKQQIMTVDLKLLESKGYDPIIIIARL